MQPKQLLFLLLLTPILCVGQIKFNITYYYASTFCSTSFIFHEDSTYFKEHGCEGDSHVSVGKWRIYKDTLLLEPFSNKIYNPIESITATKVPGDSVYVVIKDKNDSNITEIMKLGILVEGIGLYPFNNYKTFQSSYKRVNGKLYFKTLERIFRKSYELETETANNFVIKLNIGPEYFQYEKSEWNNEEPFKLFIKKGDLIDLNSPPENVIIYKTSQN